MARSRRTKGSDRTVNETKGGRLGGLLGRRAALRRTSTAALAGSAGRATSEFEALENRQLLFNLTVDPGDPSFVPSSVDGYGTVTAFFGYAIPNYAPTTQFQAQAPTTETIDFNQANLGPLVTNTVIGQHVRLRFDANTATIVGVPPNNTERFARFALDSGQFLSIQYREGAVDPLSPPEPARDVESLRSITFAVPPTVGDQGLDPTLMTVELLMRGEVLRSYTGQALLDHSANGTPFGTFFFNTAADPDFDPDFAFDEIRFVNTGGAADAFSLDDVTVAVIQGEWIPLVQNRLFGARVDFSGPIGANAEFLDLYGRDMQRTLDVLKWDQQNHVLFIDLNDDSVPDFNDGIGRINITGSDAKTAMTMFGGRVTGAVSTGVVFTLTQNIAGFYDAFETSGFGFVATPVQGSPTFTVTGLPPGPGSVIVGSPFIRDNSSRTAYDILDQFGLPAPRIFTRTDQGFFVNGGADISSIYLHGMLFGTSRLTGTADRFVVGSLLGSLNVSGDMGVVMSGSDAGAWTDDDGGPAMARTGSTLTVGRTLREFSVAGRSLVNVTVIGDLNNPGTRPARDVLRFYESEFANNGPATGSTVPVSIGVVIGNNDAAIENKTFGGVRFRDQGLIYGTGYYRNDTLLSAEWVGSVATAVEIHGDIGGGDPVNTLQDQADVYAFAATAAQDITVRLLTEPLGVSLWFRIVDRDGRTVATPNITGVGRDEVALRFTPSQPGVYYLVVHTPSDGTNATDDSYVITLAGSASTSLGAYRSGGQSGRNLVGQGNLINVLNGSVGNIWVGAGFVNGGGAQADPVAIFNPSANPDEDAANEYLSMKAMTISVNRDLYGMTIGGDIEGAAAVLPVTLTVGRNFGTLITGRNPVAGTGAGRIGDLRNFNFTVQGAIAELDIRGAIGVDTQSGAYPLSVDLPSTVVVRTGQNALLRGDIGMIRVGGHVAGDSFVLRTSNGSTVGGFLVSQDIAIDPNDPAIGIYLPGGQANGVDLRLGINSDLRFFDVPQIDLLNVEDRFIRLNPNVPQIFTDDAGGQVRMQIIGGDANTTGLVRVIPISGSLGVAIGRVEVNLTGGARLQITGLGNVGSTDVVSIGRIIVTGSDAANPGSIGIDGNTQVDVWRIDDNSDGGLTEVLNDTPNGDVVAIDAAALGRYESRSGDLGRTQVPAWGPKLIGPFLGITGQAQGGAGAGAPINVDPAQITGFWNGNLYRPVNSSSIALPPASWADDVGMPVDPYLNGVIVRTGDLTSVSVGGAVGDVIVQQTQQQNGVGGNIVQVTANADRITPAGRFDGIIGSLYAMHGVGNVDIGDGLAKPEPLTLSTTGIFAGDAVGTVTGSLPGSFISGPIIGIGGINIIDLRPGGGSIVDAFIGSMNLDNFWDSPFAPDAGFYGGTINEIHTNGGNLFRSVVQAGQVNLIFLQNGFYDATETQVADSIGRIEAAGFRNSTLHGTASEFRQNSITVAGDLGTITTTGRLGDISDLTVETLGHVTEISAFNIIRSRIDSDFGIALLQAVNDFRSISVTAGLLTRGAAGRNIMSSSFRIAGPLQELSAGDAISSTLIVISGPDGRLDNLTARTRLNANITSAGPIGSILVSEGSLSGSIRTLTSLRGVPGNIHSIRAAQDIVVSTDIAGTVDEFIAGRHIGELGSSRMILVRGDVVTISAGSQIYDEFRLRGGVTGSITIGPAVNTPGNQQAATTGGVIAFGRIQQVDITGDFGGKLISYSGGIGVVTINDGSFLASGVISAFDGDLQNIFINNGNFYGTAHADRTLFAIRLNGSDDGVFGDIGVNPAFNPGSGYDQFRNQLPPGVVAGGANPQPNITAGQLGRIVLTNGSIFSAFIYSQRAIGTIDVTGDITREAPASARTTIAAGSSIFLVRASGNITDTFILAGIRNFGADNRAGGTGANADTVQSGRITTVHADGAGNNVAIAAGIDPGPDGQYNTSDELVVLGISFVREATFDGGVTNVTVFADSPTLTASSGVVRGGTALPNADPDLNNGSPTGSWVLIPGDGSDFHFTWQGVTGTITYVTDKGQAYFDTATGTVNLVNSSLNSELRVFADATLSNFSISSNDDASVGLIEINTNLAGNSKIVIDAYVLAIRTQSLLDNTVIRTGMNTRAVTVNGNFSGGSLTTALWMRDLIINGNFGTPDAFGEARIDSLAAGTITINGNDSGLISITRDLSSATVTGAMDFAQLRTGNTLGSLTAGSMNQSRVSTGDDLGPVAVTGSVTDSVIQSGADLGSDVAPGGTGEAADAATAGNIASVAIGGDLVRSSIVAGLLRGPDAFFGTTDDSAGPGLSNIGAITIGGSIIGSNLNTEQYRIAATGLIGARTVTGDVPGEGSNFAVTEIRTLPASIRVNEIQVTQESFVWVARIFFNQKMDASTIAPALSISEVRDGGATLIPLVQGVDYIVDGFDTELNAAVIRFSRDVTDRSLSDSQGGMAGPGVYRFELVGTVLRSEVASARLDANADGTANDNEVFSQDEIVGDAGDKFEPEVIGNVDIYGPTDLDVVMDNNYTPDSLPDVNRNFTIRGAIGDHPDQDPTEFPSGGDTDLYRITLKAGQILRLGAMDGNAMFAGRFLFNANQEFQGGSTADTLQLPVDPLGVIDLTEQDAYLIKTTGVYFIAVTNTADFLVPGLVPQVQPGPGDTGDYTFTVQVFDDGDSGFAADNDSGNGTPLVVPPLPIDFAGPNGIFQNPGDPGFDDLSSKTVGAYVFTLDAGADGVRGTGDDIVTGTDFRGITIVRRNGQITSTVNSSIGPSGHSGVPADVASDVDVFHLNNGQPIPNGQRITIRVKLSEQGADLGSFSQLTGVDFSGDVQFAVFDTSDATNITDATLVFSPTDFLPSAGTPGTIATQGDISYGYDENGDFFISFVTPGKIGGAAGETASYAVYLQGVFNTDYTLEVTQQAGTPTGTVPQAAQNIFIETHGGTVDWLMAGGLLAKLQPYTASVLGLTGAALGGLPVDTYVLNSIVANLRAAFTAAGLNVNISTNRADFEFQQFSTVFLTSSSDPINLFEFDTDNYGYSEHSDPFNADHGDEAVVFLPSFADLGLTPSQFDIDRLANSLTAAVGRRVGELMGLRIEADDTGDNLPEISMMAANSVRAGLVPGVVYRYQDGKRDLSDRFDSVSDTNFWLGQQNAFALLDKFITP